MARAPAAQEVEVLPEADRLEGFPHPRETASLFGHEQAQRALANSFFREQLHHAWIIAGRAGIGKATLAYRFARFLLAEAQERDCARASFEVDQDTAAARQVAALSHPGLLLIRRLWDARAKRFSASIPVDEVRRLRGFLAHTADTGAWRVVIVDSVDELNANAANALLKSLEEPPGRTVFLLIAAEPGRLLPTIRSRCRTLALAPLSSNDLRRAATAALEASETRIAQEAIAALEPIAEGSVRRLLELAASGGAALYERVQAILPQLPRVDWPAAHVLADDLANPASQQRFDAFFSLLLGAIARNVRSAAAQGEEGRLVAWAEAWEDIVREKAEAAELNLDRRALVLGTLSRLATAARP